jgi:mannose-6-phosphate isomerase-like protein (cupin superfamily)
MAIRAVRKPWGFEYPLFESDSVGLWALFLDAGQSTSLHCHPRKKTGLVVLEGEVEVAFFNERLTLNSGGRVMIRPGLFHGSKATSARGAIMLEIENPRDKNDLVRFEDKYGREDLPYEGDEHFFCLEEELGLPTDLDHLMMDAWIGNDVQLRFIKGVRDIEQPDWTLEDTVLVVAGSIGQRGSEVLGPGDVVSVNTIQKIALRFPLLEPLDLLVVTRRDA